jgi:hypothetical protein
MKPAASLGFLRIPADFVLSKQGKCFLQYRDSSPPQAISRELEKRPSPRDKNQKPSNYAAFSMDLAIGVC